MAAGAAQNTDGVGREANYKGTILILGKSGSGKSTVGNILLGRDTFSTGVGLVATTTKVQCETVHDIQVIDTPAVNFITSPDEAEKEISSWKSLILSQSQAIILWVIPSEELFTKDSLALYKYVRKCWNDDAAFNRMVIAFTFVDRLNKPLTEELKTKSTELAEILQDAKEHYVVYSINDTEDEKNEQTQRLFRFLDADIGENQLDVTDAVSCGSGSNMSSTESVKDEGKASIGHTQSPTLSEDPITILLIGKTGNGKSSVGNTILGAKVIDTSDAQHQEEDTDHFDIGVGMWSTTQTANFRQMTYNEKTYKVIDTPDISEMDKDKEQKEIQRWQQLLCGQANVYVLCVRCDVRYTAEEFAIYKKLKESLGSSFNGRLMIAFTFGDRQKEDITEELKSVCKELQTVLEEAGGLYVVFDNTASRNDKEYTQKTFFEKVVKLGQRNAAMIPKEVASEDKPQLQEHSEAEEKAPTTVVGGTLCSTTKPKKNLPEHLFPKAWGWARWISGLFHWTWLGDKTDGDEEKEEEER